MTKKSKLGIGVAGLGVGERHARIIHGLNDVKLLKLYDPNLEKAHLLATELNAQATQSFDDLLDTDIDIIIVASPDHFHGEHIVKALKSGKHVFAEKPLCNTAKELQSIVYEWRKRKNALKLYSNLILRIAPLYEWLKKKVEDGFFGEIYSVDGDYLYGRKEKILNGWRGTGENYSGMKGGGIHLIDLMCWLTDQRPVSVKTMGNDICTRNSGVTINDYMSSMFRFESGLVGRVTANLGCVHRHHHILRIFGTKATFIFDDRGARIHHSSDPALEAGNVALEPLPHGKSDLIPAFVTIVQQDRISSSQTEDTFSIVSILAACDKSLKSGLEEQIIYL